MTRNEKKAAASAGDVSGRRVIWDDGDMKSSYANVCNVASTREEIVLLFGTNQAWKGVEEEVRIQLSDRIIMSPFAAKRLSQLLENVIRQYESRFGPLDTAPIATVPPTTSTN